MQYTFENNLIKAIFPTCFMRLRGEGCLLTNAIPTATKDSEATGKHLPPEEFHEDVVYKSKSFRSGSSGIQAIHFKTRRSFWSSFWVA